jgi:molybdate transport system substrate-binding protein
VRWVPALIVALAAAHAAGENRAGSARQPLHVFAAASLTESFETIAAAFEQAHADVAVQLVFAGSSTLVRQIREGAPADVFAAADEANMEKLASAGDLAGDARVFAANRLTIVVPRGNPHHIATLADLTTDNLTVVLAAPAVPAGKYAAEAFAKAGLAVPAASQEPDVKAVLNKVALGEADAGIVYVTDARAAAGKVDAVAIPDAFNVTARYPIAVLKSAAAPTRAAAFVAFILSDRGRAVLGEHGFLPP